MSSKKYKIKKYLQKFIIDNDHPCLMAQTVVKQKNIDFDVYTKMNSSVTAQQLLQNIGNYLNNYDFNRNDFNTYIAVFPYESPYTEEEFENNLWDLLSLVNRYDPEPWDPTVSSNPQDNNFSFSIQGKAFYVVGMHPNSSRAARRTKYPLLAFNLHWQFEQLRKHGLYHTVRNDIRSREIERNGSVNPVLKDFGKASEALQYSGKNNTDNWTCPFQNSKHESN
ncbi:YqcI/YcgG family protein [Winogradskyella sp. ZXX205]|uniref:YqcI/YcgG family protein n=2 Tax=Winogradskyella ouciana TaxID=2608631 RepID=A0A7K1GBF8_9FLAO|nr:YqcI/YcgG family protein [Winogradskyella ouciana]